MKFVHAADLHVDSPLRGLDRYEGAPATRLRSATRGALENLVSLCLEERAAFLLLAGDVFDGSWKDYSTGLFFVAQMARLREANVPVVIVRGNHDAQSSVVKALRLPDNVHELSAKKAESYELRDANVLVHGQSFAQRATSDDLAARYPDARSGVLNVGLLHTSVDGREGHEPYAPTSLSTMRAKGYDYWALGHVHAREVLSTDPWIVFPGNVQGRHARERGPKGASLVTVVDGAIASVEHRALDVARWDLVTVDASAASDALDVVDLARDAIAERVREAGERVLATRVVVSGRTRADGRLRRDPSALENELRAAATDAFGDGVWIEKVKLETRSEIAREALANEPGAIGHLARRLAEIRGDDAQLRAVAQVLADLDKKLPSELREGEDALLLTDPDFLRGVLDDVEGLLLPALLEGDG